jgi:hypothetical protein
VFYFSVSVSALLMIVRQQHGAFQTFAEKHAFLGTLKDRS